MLKAEKAAMNKASGEGIAFSAKKKYNKNTTYDEYASLVQQWSHSASTKPKDMKIFNYKGKDFRLLEATEDGDYIEIVRGNFKKVESVYAEARREIDKYRETVYESADRYEAERNGNSWNSLNDKVRGTNGQNSQQIEGDRLSSDTSGNYEYNRSSDSGKDVSYSAKPSETAQRITENFGYTETTANNIVKAARTLKQKADSKADTNELAYTIAQTLEDRRNGNTDGRDAELIAMMLAENAEAVNEDFVAEYKPIIDRLNGMTISISEADISDLGDAFSYVKKRLFPTVVLYI